MGDNAHNTVGAKFYKTAFFSAKYFRYHRPCVSSGI